MRLDAKKQGQPRKKKASLFKRGNVGLTHILLIVRDAGPDGITTVKLFNELGSTGYGQRLITRAEKEGYIKRVIGESEHGHFPPVYNILTKKGKQLLANL